MPKGIYPRTEEHKKNLGLAHIGNKSKLGMKDTEITKRKKRISHIGKIIAEKNGNWKEDKVSYSGLHI